MKPIIKNKLNINRNYYIQEFIEEPENINIYGTAYEKGSLVPLFKETKFAPFKFNDASNYKCLLGKKFFTKNYNGAWTPFGSHLFNAGDNYSLVSCYGTNTDEIILTGIKTDYILKFSKEGERLSMYSLNNSHYILPMIIHEDNQYVYLYAIYRDGSYDRSYFFNKINKATMGLVYGFRINGAIFENDSRLFFDSDRNLFFYVRNIYNNTTNTIIFNKIDVISGTNTVLGTISKGLQGKITVSKIKETNDYITCFITIPSTNTNPGYDIYLLKYDKNSGDFTYQKVNIDWKGQSAPRYSFNNANMCIITNRLLDDKLFFAVVEGNATNGNNTGTYYLYTFDASDEENLTLIGKTYLGADRPRYIMSINDENSALLVIYNGRIDVRTYNSVTGEFDLANTIPGDFVSVAIDSFYRIWLMENTTYNLYMIIPNEIYTIDLEFPTDTITWTGSPIITQLKVNVYNVYGNRISKDIRLIIESGNAVFNDNGEREIVITTSNSADTFVDVKILGVSLINIVAEEV